ncbi:MAG: sel1 repeat family protein [Bernardetiaceae bacterium]|nr:sel1 repeat family protein [Bernardetiaceae bacterium]
MEKFTFLSHKVSIFLILCGVFIALENRVEAQGEFHTSSGFQNTQNASEKYRKGKQLEAQQELRYYHAALAYYEEAAEQNYAPALLRAAMLHENGNLGEIDNQKSLYYYQKAATYGSPEALYRMGVFYEEGQLLPANMYVAIDYYLKAWKADNKEAAIALTYLPLEHYKTPDNSLDIITFKAKNDDAAAQYHLAKHYYKNRNKSESDKQQALHWLEQAADKGHTDALYLLGIAYEKGTLGEQNVNKAILILEKAAAQGHAQAPAVIAKYGKRMDKEDAELVNSKNNKSTYKIANSAAQAYNLGLYYQNQKNGESKAASYFLEAAAAGHSAAKDALRSKLFKDWAREDMPISDLEIMAEIGNQKAMFILGKMYWTGSYGVEKNIVKAYRLFQRVAPQYYPEVLKYLGIIHLENQIPQASISESVLLLERYVNVKNKDGEGFYYLGKAYWENQKRELAINKFKLADNLGHKLPREYALLINR